MFLTISIIVLLFVFLLIAIRRIGNVTLPIWLIMLLGAVIVLITREISLAEAFKAINFDVIFFLFGMFIIGQALEQSGYLEQLSYHFFKRTETLSHLLLFVIFGAGLLSAILMNDTLAIIGTPIVLLLSKTHKKSSKLLLLALCFAVTIGSVLSPIGNPQNLLIAINGGMPNPFVSFLEYLFIPTIINLFVLFFFLRFFYKDEFTDTKLLHVKKHIEDHKLANLCKVSLALVIFLIFVKVAFVFLKSPFDFRLIYIALIGALPIVLFSSKRIEVVKKIDWSTLVFFASMFVLMQSVWNSGFFQSLISGINISSVFAILLISIILSQFISNVPLVALYLPLLLLVGAGTKQMAALAVGSTIAGNLFILGAASNIIIIQNAEKKGETITFLEFAKIGIPLTIINLLIYWLFLVII